MLNDEGHTVEVIPPLDLQNPDGNPDVLFKHMIKYVSDCRNLDEAICLQFAYGLVKNERSVSIDNLSFLIDENAIIPNGRNEIIKFGIHLGLNGNLYAAMPVKTVVRNISRFHNYLGPTSCVNVMTRILFLRSSPLWMNVLAQTFEIKTHMVL